ncbi:TSUP family transporter [Crassaminicella profunda]|uniref:TSUP family transporter n=1 Tax=Crassaminicella profunda TaxID=1286698 RepID=UPI001CA76A4E|nr:TSUP family transporter [Crassaminicella profunda]QZY53936.1 TSUP family transporter [Crassaminicella profunda]
MEMKIVYLCFFGFLAQFVDSIAGGGGLISIPALFAFGIPPHFALGTNKLGAIFGTVSSSAKFIQSKKVHFAMLKYMIPATIIGAILGVNTVLLIDQKILNIIVTILLFIVCIYTIFKKDLGSEDHFTGMHRKNIIIGASIAFTLGFYDGFFGPGAGSFLIFSFITFLGFDFLISCGNAKILNTTSVITSFIVFAFHGKVIYSIGIPMGICMMLGALLGTQLAIKNGAKLIKPIFIVISICFMLKLSLNIL